MSQQILITLHKEFAPLDMVVRHIVDTLEGVVESKLHSDVFIVSNMAIFGGANFIDTATGEKMIEVVSE